MAAIDRQKVRHSFERHAAEYETHACVQKRVVERFARFVLDSADVPSRLLDLGAGTGLLLGALSRIWPGTELVGLDMAHDMGVTARSHLFGTPGVSFVTADAEQIPFPEASFDRVVSTSTFQWLDRLDSAFAEASRVLRPSGSFHFALFGEKTLHELRDSYRTACMALGKSGSDRPQQFFGPDDIVAALSRTGFHSCVTLVEVEMEMHPDVPALLRSIRRIGAANPAPVASRGLSERRVMIEMMNGYRRNYGQGGEIPATYEVIYGRGMKR